MEQARLDEQFQELLSSRYLIDEELDPAVLEDHLRLLSGLDRINTGALSHFGLHRREHVFPGEGFATIRGWDLARARANTTCG